jgi:hypothetical protein
MMSGMTLVEFLLARIAEDEEGARRASAVEGGDFAIAALPLPLMEGIRPGFPTRVLAECEAKRRIVDLYREVETDRGNDAMSRLDRVLRALALPYVAHPDYRVEWRP